MKASINTVYGPPEIIRIQEIARPVPKDDEVLIKVHASTVNRTDCGFRSANYFISRFWSGLLRPKNPVLGCEFAGEIEAVGKQVTLFQPGDRVFGYDDARFGAHAEYMTLPADAAIALLPDNFSYDEAAPMLEGGHYAWNDIKAAKVTKGQKVLVNGATGAIGSAAVQLLKYLEVDVTAVCAGEHLEKVSTLGADRVIDYTREDFTQSGQLYDFVFDAVGKSSFGKCKAILKPKGIYISTELGKGSQNVFLALLTPLFKGKKVLFPIPGISRQDALFFRELAQTGKFRPLIDRKYPLDEIIDAYRYVETRQKIGNVVIGIAG